MYPLIVSFSISNDVNITAAAAALCLIEMATLVNLNRERLVFLFHLVFCHLRHFVLESFSGIGCGEHPFMANR